MSNLTGPSFYEIDFEREIVLQGKSTTFLTINRNDSVLSANESLYVLFYPNTRTFESVGSFDISQSLGTASGSFVSEGFINQDFSEINSLKINNIGEGLFVKNTQDFLPDSEGPLVVKEINLLNTSTGPITKVKLEGPTGGTEPFIGATGSLAAKKIVVGYYTDKDKGNWKINTVSVGEIEQQIFSTPATGGAADYTSLENPFDGSIYNANGGPVGGFTGTGAVTRDLSGFSVSTISTSSPGLTGNRGITVRIDYEGNDDSHLKLNMLIFRFDPTDPIDAPLIPASPLIIQESIAGPYNPGGSFSSEMFGFKSGLGGAYSDNVDYQEVHLFGYTDTTVRTSRTKYQNSEIISNPIYDDRSSYSVLKTNPKLTGNVKLTIDTVGELSLNSFDANNQLSDSKYKRVPVSVESQYQRDVHAFFAGTPNEVIFQLYQIDNQYQNTKRDFFRQFDNFYNYGVEQLASKFYDEDFSFLAPLWMRKNLPDYFVIFRVDHPASIASYEGLSTQDLFNEIFQGARIIKTYDMRATSKLGRYLRKITDDPRFKERPLEVSYDQDVPTTWYGISIADATMTGKSEFLYDFWKTDRPIKEFEEYVTSGFERNGIISANLINLEFLFDDPEASLYSINRYFGLYVSEVQLAELELASSILGKISGQTPEPKPNVDGEPYSTRPFIQTNPNGIELPVEYYHNTKFANNTSVIPYYQGNVIGKLPLPAMVDDPLRIFYVKDRDDVFKRVIGLSEVDYGFPGTEDYKRVTQLKLFDTTEDISKYGGPKQIISQVPASLLDSGNAQLILHLINQGSGDVIAEEEVLELSVKNYNTSDKVFNYHFQVSAVGGTATTFTYFQDQEVTTLSSNFTQPAMGATVSITAATTSYMQVGETVYIVGGGYYQVEDIVSSTVAVIKNLGVTENAIVGSTVFTNSLIGSYPTGFATYTYTALDYRLSIDNNITLDLTAGYTTPPVSSYVLRDSFNVNVNYPEVIQTITNGSNSINAIVSPQYQQYRWRMTAKATGLKKEKAWPFPVEDPNGYDYISNFNNEGTPEQVAKAIASCINSFDNSPAHATADGNKVFLKSKLQTYDGNTILFTRYMVPKVSYIRNLGYYEDGNVIRKAGISSVSYPGFTSTDKIGFSILEENDVFGDFYYYVKVLKTPGGNNIIIRSDVDTSSWTSITTTGSYQSFYTTENVFKDSAVPFSLDITDVSSGSYQDFVIKLSYISDSTQFFVGGAGRNRSRAKITTNDAQRYYQDRKITVSSVLTQGSTTVNVTSTEGIYVGAPIVGSGVPSSTKVLLVEPAGNYIIMSAAATESGTFEIEYGNLSILNDTQFLQQWFQTAKSQFSRMLPWDVQGKWIYSLPFLEEPILDARNRVIDYTDKNGFSIIEIEDQTQSFYLSDERRVIAYEMYRPTVGLFSVFPIKEFDFDFFLSDYSYSPTLETLRYFFNETLEDGQTTELPADGNYVIVPQIIDPTDPQQLRKIGATGTFGFTLEGYNTETQSWNVLSEVSSTTTESTNGLIINTYTPFYRYDIDEHPQRYDDPSYYLVRGIGLRNYERALITKSNDDKTVTPIDVKKFRITYNGTTLLPYLNIKKSDFSEDNDIINFGGFAALQDILNLNDQQAISFLRSQGLFVEAYLRQQLKSEYDRLRENFTKQFATLSRVVPFINKWVQEGTDARDNYYRLNNSLAFGLSNLSPDDSVDFAEPLILSHEFPYLDTVPKDYPEESVSGSRSYMFAKLSDVAYEGKSWYDLITSDITRDWFLKYFSVGYPTEINYNGEKITKPREERFTFLTYNEGLQRVQTLFRGVKINAIEIDTNQPTLPELLGSVKYTGYKFSAIQRIIPYNFYKIEPPLEIEIIKNDTFKSITLIITKRTQDYRVQSGLHDYLFNYAANDNLKNYNQQQYKISSFTSSDSSLVYPYEPSIPSTYTDQSTMRPRQLFYGGGYLQIGDPKLSGYIDVVNNIPVHNNTPTPYLSFFLNSSDSAYPFVVPDEVNPFENKYPVGGTAGNYPFVYDFSSVEILPFSFAQEGFLTKFLSTGTGSNLLITYDFTDTRKAGDTILIDSVGFSSPSRYNAYRHQVSSVSLANGLLTFTYPHGSYAFSTLETFNLQGGNEFYSNTKNLYSFANIKKNINNNTGLVKYYNVTENGKEETEEFRLVIISADQIIKSGVLNTIVDEDRPPQYANAPLIGYDIVNTNQNELVIRHRGYYEPKSIDIISFWVREDEEMTRHFEKDFLLSNTHINSVSPAAGIIKNYGINKVAPTEILKISEGTAYRSVYQYINEISVDSKDMQVLNSTWDADFYRRYTDLNMYALVDGIYEMTEFKSFLGSKAMVVPKALDIQTFLDTEVTYQVIAPSIGTGLTTTDDGTTKPNLVIDLQLENRLIRELISRMEDADSVDEFDWAYANLGISTDLSPAQINALKETYIRTNIVPLYEVSDVILYSLEKDGIPVFVINLSEADKIAAGYRQDKDCVVRNTSKFNFTITKTLDTKKSIGYSVGVILKRI